MIDIERRLTRFFHCEGTSTSGWTTAASALKRCQVGDRKQFGRRDWADYPAGRMGWVTSAGRCIGVGALPAKPGLLKKGEILIPITLPFEGSGKTLRKQVEKFVRKMNKVVRAA